MILRSKTSGFLHLLLVILTFSVSPLSSNAKPTEGTKSTASGTKTTATSTKTSAAASTDKKASTSPASSNDKKTAMPVIYDFGAAWCVPCKKFAPIFDKVAESYKGKADFQHIDADDEKNKALVDKYKVMSLPTIVFVDKAGKTVATKNKVMTEAELVQQMDSLIK